MAWQLEDFLLERVERGRTLLAESEEHRGSPDLQVGVGSGAVGAAAAGSGQPGSGCSTPPSPIDPSAFSSVNLSAEVCGADVPFGDAAPHFRGGRWPAAAGADHPAQAAGKQAAAAAVAVLPSCPARLWCATADASCPAMKNLALARCCCGRGGAHGLLCSIRPSQLPSAAPLVACRGSYCSCASSCFNCHHQALMC